VVVPMEAPHWTLDEDRLAAAVGPRTKAIVLTTPHNPTGRVLTDAELSAVADVAVGNDLLVFTDEIYEHIVYDGRRHRSIALLPGMAERTITISALSKTYSVTGWRVGWAIGDPRMIDAIRKVHDFLTVAAPTPLQEAGVAALEMPDAYYRDLAGSYQDRRDLFLEQTSATAFGMYRPEGAYYAMAEVGGLRERIGAADDVAFCRELVLRAGVASVPGSSFFADARLGRDLIRFAFPKRLETLGEAAERLASFSEEVIGER